MAMEMEKPRTQARRGRQRPRVEKADPARQAESAESTPGETVVQAAEFVDLDELEGPPDDDVGQQGGNGHQAAGARAPDSPDIDDSHLPTLEATDLPSKMLPYPKGARVLYKPYTFGHVLNASESGADRLGLFEHVVLSGITCVGMDKTDLTLADFLFLGVARRVSSLGDVKFSVVYECRDDLCRRKNRLDLTSESLNFDYIRAESIPVKVKEVAGLTNCEFWPVTVGEFLTLARKGMDSKLWIAAHQCRSHKPEEAYKAFGATYGRDASILRKVDYYLYHSLRPVPAECPACGVITRVALDGWEAVIVPFRGSEDPDDYGISFGPEGGG